MGSGGRTRGFRPVVAAERYPAAVQWGNVAAWVSAGLSALFGVLSWWSARKSKSAEAEAKAQAKRALAAAEDAAAAGQRSADAAERAAAVLEDQHRFAVEQAEAVEGVPWEIRYRTGSKWELWNITDTPKFNVAIGGSGVMTTRNPVAYERIDGRSAEEFWGTSHWGSGTKVEVTWHRSRELDDEPLTWAGNLPPKAG